MMQDELRNTIELLGRTPATLDAMLRDLPDFWTRRNEGQDTWSAFDVVGHLIHCERTDWIPRARIILQHGESRTFDPFDRTGHFREIQGKSLPQLLDELTRMRGENLRQLRGWNLQESQLALRGRHPSLGTVTLGQLLAAWAAHDLTHLHQISRLMAHQYREAVGPWAQYMGVLQCNGHSGS